MENLQENIIPLSFSCEQDQDSYRQIDSLPLGNDEDMHISSEISRNQEKVLVDFSDFMSIQSSFESIINDKYEGVDGELWDERLTSTPESKNQFIMKEEHKSLSLSLDIYPNTPVYDAYDDDIALLDRESPFMKHFDQHFHETNKPIVNEESDPAYDSYGSESEPSFDEQISTLACIETHSSEPLYDSYESYSLEDNKANIVVYIQDACTTSRGYPKTIQSVGARRGNSTQTRSH
jgi:hypothetical protein